MKFFQTPIKKKISVKSKIKDKKKEPKQIGQKVIRNYETRSDNIRVNENISRNRSNTKFSPGIPVKPKNAYFLFQNEVKEEFRKDNPFLTWGQLISKIAKAYKELATEEKEKYNTKAKEMKDLYEESDSKASKGKNENWEMKNMIQFYILQPKRLS